MAGKDLHSFFAYPARGLGILAIFICVSPAIQALVFLFFSHQWVGGENLLIEITDLLSQRAFNVMRQGFAIYMPSAFISGIVCAFVTGRGQGLTMNGAIMRSVVVVVSCEMLIDLIVYLNKIYQPSELIMKHLFSAIVAGVLAGWFSWIISKRFYLDQSVEENSN